MDNFKGGEKLLAHLKLLAEKVANPVTLRVGFLENATYPENQGGQPVAMVAAIQEFGAPSRKVPPRPYFRTMIAAKKNGWGAKFGKIIKASDFDAKKAMALLGEDISADLRESIINTNSPPLSPITVMLRGMRSHDQSLVVSGKTVGEAARRVAQGLTNYGASDKVLDDTGHMLHSVDYEVN